MCLQRFLLRGLSATMSFFALVGLGLAAQDAPPAEPSPFADNTGVTGKKIVPLTEGPIHEAFISPVKDGEPVRLDSSPPPPITELPGLDRPTNSAASWIGGYWEWDNKLKDFVWVSGTWRIPPPSRFWANGYWKRDEESWSRVAGFWSDKQTNQIVFKQQGPPADRPEDKIPPSPGAGYFYVPGHYAPEGEKADGFVWKPGFWAKAQQGWAWVPAQWIRQSEGWIYQEGYWDRPLNERGVLYAPVQVAPEARNAGTVYRPDQVIDPNNFDQLFGSIGRKDQNYDGYPGVRYEDDGTYQGYSEYGNYGQGYVNQPGAYYTYPNNIIGGYGYGASPYYGMGFGMGGFGGLGLYGMGSFGYPFYGGYGYGGYPFGVPIGYGSWERGR